MNKRSSRNKHEKTYHSDVKENKTYWRNLISIAISILIVGGIAFYLKNVNVYSIPKYFLSSEKKYNNRIICKMYTPKG
jgi:hypothetical protein